MNWIKNNLVLVSGIVLPVLLVLGFFVLTQLPRALAEPPEHDFLVLAYRYDAQNRDSYQLSFEVREGRLYAVIEPLEDRNAYPNRQHARLFRYVAAEESFDEINFELRQGIQSIEESISFPVAEAAGLVLDKRVKSPDGYVFENLGYRGRGGLLGEIFGMGRRYESQYVLSRGGAQFPLPSPTPDRNYYGQDVQFLAWVTGEANDRD